MSKRQRTVFPTDEVCHLWAHQVQDHARNAHGNVYFRGDTIYSYGSHFPMARHVFQGAGHAVLYTNRTYSQTTAGHLSSVRSALHNHLPYFTVPDLFPDKATTPDFYGNEVVRRNEEREEKTRFTPAIRKATKKRYGHRANLLYFAMLIEATVEQLKRSRESTRMHLDSIERHVDDGNRYARFFQLDELFKIPQEVEDQWDQLVERADYWEDRRTKRNKARQQAWEAQCRKQREEREKLIQKYLDLVVRWRAGERIQLPEMPWELRDKTGVALRLRGPVIQTALGVTVAIDEAVKILELVRAGVEKKWGYEWREVDGESTFVDTSDEAPKIGPYPVTHVLANGDVHVSCHFIKKDEIERIAGLLGLWPDDEPPPGWYGRILAGLEPPPPPVKRMLDRRKRTIRIMEIA